MTTIEAPAPEQPKRKSLYRGDPGMWSWALHRITGVTLFFFLFVHVLDTALVRVHPDTYSRTIETYKNPLVALLEMALVVCVLFHAFNGVRVILVDFWSKGPRYQRQMLWIVLAVWIIVSAAGVGRQFFYLFTEH
ncbi:succinate dehydrogenase, cytochrome b556 subunit [Nocardia panacis]|uniref:Succinate dehydrogenase, cytochrome b556 subunit n=1 Tax=Nocardia panacis TaxID=2340916 RepID=A0A3A4KFV4_9NOCA|nr:succinate dehydrogenase, cytochrome b556 subunit [Nocardia panacis]RJO72236.1 succinate dehydrogenase, cytochrome b556 subunit [Nocardia panacis]